MTTTTRIFRFYEEGGPLKLETVPVEQPGPGEVRLKVEAIGINRVEELFQKGGYFIRPSVPSKLGVEGAGVVEAVGPDVDPSWIGKRFALVPSMDMQIYGIAGETAIEPVACLVETPDNVAARDAAATWMAYLTAYGAIVSAGMVKPSDFVLINAASSSVGLAMMQVVRAIGAKSIAVTRTADKKQVLTDLGADHVIVSTAEDIVAVVRDITAGVGVRLAFDAVAGEGVMQLAELTTDNGTVMIGGYLGTDMFGYKDGRPTPFPFIQAVSRNLNIRGYSSRGLFAHEPELAKAKLFICEHLASGVLRPTIDRTVPLERLEEAYDGVRANDLVGKVVVLV
jgi:NADPH:quinone reductase-like Zn-dependent oxidoreductase